MSAATDTRNLWDRISHRLTALGISEREGGKRAKSADTLRNIHRAVDEGRAYNLRTDTLEAIARALETSPRWLQYGEGPEELHDGAQAAPATLPTPRDNSPTLSPAPFATGKPALKADASYPMPVAFPPRRLPVYGQAAGGLEQDGKFVLNGQKVADVLCPPQLENVRDAFAVFMHGESMRPAFRPGDTLYIDPTRPVKAGDEVLVQIKGEDDEPPYGFVKEFMRKNAKELVLLQHNPPEGQEKIITFPVERVMTVHKVVGSLRG